MRHDEMLSPDKMFSFQESVADPSTLPSDSLLVQTMASCHSLVKIDGELTGYPMDIKLFEAINWVCPNISLIVCYDF